MTAIFPIKSAATAGYDLTAHGLINLGTVHANLSAAALVEHALRRGEGLLTESGALVALTGERTGRSPRDKFLVVEDHARRNDIAWGAVNRSFDADTFQRLYDRTRAYLQGRELFIFDGWACADVRHRLPVRVDAEKAWHALFSRCLLLRPDADRARSLAGFQPQLTIIAVPDMKADPATDGTTSGTFILLNLSRGLVLIGGTHYAGEIKKSVFTFLNYLLPQQGVFPMHCSANIGVSDDVALFFGLSGTGKTTLSADRERRLIGDDEHGWSESGVFNIEGGCYAKCIRLSKQSEPQIYNAIRFGSVLENVVVDPGTRQPNYDDQRWTENTRAAYPVDFIDNAEPAGQGGHPRNVVFLCCDAFGVMPPLAKLTPDQALYHFLSGYTAKIAGTEAGVTEPQATFSTCFAAPFLPLHPTRYAELLRERLVQHGSQVWLVNTGWTGGPYGVGKRMPLAWTRAMLRAALAGELNKARFHDDPVFGVAVPQSCPGVPDEVLKPRSTWADPASYDSHAARLASLFRNNFSAYAAHVSDAVKEAGPR